MDWLKLLLGLAPAILAAAKVPPALIAPIAHGMADAQSLPGATGEQKKAAVMSIVADGVEAVNAAKKKTVLDPELTAAAASAGIDTTIAAFKLVKQAHGVAGV